MLRALSLSLLAALSLAGCDCTEVGCSGGLTVSFADGGLAGEGTWTLAAESERATYTCALALPAASGAEATCDRAGAEVEVSGDGLSILSLRVPPDAGAVTLRIDIDGSEVYREVLSPEYETYYPNGEECGGSCQAASLEVSVPAPE